MRGVGGGGVFHTVTPIVLSSAVEWTKGPTKSCPTRSGKGSRLVLFGPGGSLSGDLLQDQGILERLEERCCYDHESHVPVRHLFGPLW